MTSLDTGSVSSVLFESFEAIPAGWSDICAPDDLAMDPKVLGVFQRTLAGQCRCWGVIIFGAGEIAIGCAALCLFQTELIESSTPSIIRWRDRIRCIWPGFGKMRVLFCGLPIPSGSTHLRVRDNASLPLVVAEVDRVMRQLSKQVGSRLLVFKEMDEVSPLAAPLVLAGYTRGDIPPMHLMEHAFKDFAEYRGALKSRYRAQILRSQKKLADAGFDVLQGRGSAFFATYFSEQVYQLYVAVQGRAEQKLELLPRAFFLEVAASLENEVLLTVIRRDGRVCAFTFAVTRGGTHYNLYSGLDYTLNNEGDLYFNLFYSDMDQAFRSAATSLHLGQTSDSFKSRLGSHAQKLSFFAKAPSAAFNSILRLAGPLVFPQVALTEPHDVFTRLP